MPDNKLTDNEIITALMCCNTNDCRGCPYNKYNIPEWCCMPKLRTDALDLINRLQAENERLNTLIAETNEQRGAVIHAITRIDEVKAEAYKEFAENNFGGCKGCINIGFRYPYASMYPCNNCIRADMKDYYEAKELVGEDND